MTEVHEALRRWAKGLYSLEAGVGLLIHTFDGLFANASQAWSSKARTRQCGYTPNS